MKGKYCVRSSDGKLVRFVYFGSVVTRHFHFIQSLSHASPIVLSTGSCRFLATQIDALIQSNRNSKIRKAHIAINNVTRSSFFGNQFSFSSDRLLFTQERKGRETKGMNKKRH